MLDPKFRIVRLPAWVTETPPDWVAIEPVPVTSANLVIASVDSSTCAPVMVLGARFAPTSDPLRIFWAVNWWSASFENVTAVRPIFELDTAPGKMREFTTAFARSWAEPTLLFGRVSA